MEHCYISMFTYICVCVSTRVYVAGGGHVFPMRWYFRVSSLLFGLNSLLQISRHSRVSYVTCMTVSYCSYVSEAYSVCHCSSLSGCVHYFFLRFSCLCCPRMSCCSRHRVLYILLVFIQDVLFGSSAYVAEFSVCVDCCQNAAFPQ